MLTYTKTNSLEESLKLLKDGQAANVSFLDGIQFSPELGVIMSGILTNEKQLKGGRPLSVMNEWFYLEVQKQISKRSCYQQLIPIYDYFYRYNRGAYWLGKHGFDFFKIPFNRLTRFLLNPLIKSIVMLRFFHALNFHNSYFIQDAYLPYSQSLEFLKFIDKDIKVYPIYLAPLKPDRFANLSPTYIKTDLVIATPVFTMTNPKHAEELDRHWEDKLLSLSGRKLLYSYVHYSKNDFWKIYDRPSYEDLRKKFGAEDVFANLYEKLTLVENKKQSWLHLVWRLIKSPFKLNIDK